MTVQINPTFIDPLFETVVVGSNPGCLFDGSDATYVEAVGTLGSGSAVQVEFGTTVPVTDLSALPLYVRAMYRVNSGAPPDPLGMTVNARDNDNGEVFGFFSSNVAYGYEFAAPDTIYEITTWTWNEDHVGATAHMITAFALGHVNLRFDSRLHGGFEDTGLRIIECYMRGDTVRTPPPLRRYPPVNNSGFGPTRHWPRSPGRVAGKSY